MATDFGQNLQSDLYSTCWHFTTDLNIAIAPSRYNFFDILCNFGSDQSTNRKDLAGIFCTFWDKTAKIDISYQISQQVHN